VIGGLISSTVLTLVVVPVALTLLEDMARWFGFGRKPEAIHAADKATPVLQAAE
jgi:hypothetical protein